MLHCSKWRCGTKDFSFSYTFPSFTLLAKFNGAQRTGSFSSNSFKLASNWLYLSHFHAEDCLGHQLRKWLYIPISWVTLLTFKTPFPFVSVAEHPLNSNESPIRDGVFRVVRVPALFTIWLRNSFWPSPRPDIVPSVRCDGASHTLNWEYTCSIDGYSSYIAILWEKSISLVENSHKWHQYTILYGDLSGLQSTQKTAFDTEISIVMPTNTTLDWKSLSFELLYCKPIL